MIFRRIRLLTLATFLLAPAALRAQDSARVTVRVIGDSMPVEGVIVHAGRIGAQSDSRGEAVLRLPAGDHEIFAARLGWRPDSVHLVTRAGLDTTIVMRVVSEVAVIAPIIVTSTRGERRLEEEPLRVEVLAGEDVSEKNEMRPADLRTLFREMSGVRVQTTSPTLGAASVRVQGLPGRYTMVLNDGLPLYGTQATGFGLVQQPPLDLHQAEVIKGAASALYGPGAAGGVVNLVSRQPGDTSQVLANQTALGGSDVVAFVAGPPGRTAMTLLAGGHYQRAVDPDRDAWTDLAGFRRAELRPRLFVDDGNGHTLMATAGGFSETRGGGATNGSALRLDSLRTNHGDAGAVGRWRVSDALSLGMRVAGNVQQRQRVFAGAREHERQDGEFAELTATAVARRSTWVGGLAWQRDGYTKADVPRFNSVNVVPSAFVQQTWEPVTWLASTVNGRCDGSSRFGTICTPRVSVLARAGSVVSVRGSVGAGWYAPSALSDETEAIGLTRVTMPVALRAERLRTASIDVTATRGPLQVSGTWFDDRVLDPVSLDAAADSSGTLVMRNLGGVLRTSGTELFAFYNSEPLVAQAFWSSTRAHEPLASGTGTRELPLTPRNEAGIDLALEDDESGAYVAAEAFYTGTQSLEDDPWRTESHPYTVVGLIGAMRVGHATVFVNVDNLANVRQTRYEPMVLPSQGAGGRWTVDAWGPLEGRVLNGGVRYAF